MTGMSRIEITPADLDDPDFITLVGRHVEFCDATAPAESCHRLEISALRSPDLTVWQARMGGLLCGMAALKALSNHAAEIKSMHVLHEARSSGIARALLETLIKEARVRGYESLALETGSHPDFTPARALYGAFGFAEIAPFADYKPDPHSIFMGLSLR